MIKKLILILVLAIVTFGVFTSAKPTTSKRVSGSALGEKRQASCNPGDYPCTDSVGKCCPIGSNCVLNTDLCS
ncbi:hypothetical protein C1645_785202, partial [Glomus cerebriforme]